MDFVKVSERPEMPYTESTQPDEVSEPQLVKKEKNRNLRVREKDYRV